MAGWHGREVRVANASVAATTSASLAINAKCRVDAAMPSRSRLGAASNASNASLTAPPSTTLCIQPSTKGHCHSTPRNGLSTLCDQEDSEEEDMQLPNAQTAPSQPGNDDHDENALDDMEEERQEIVVPFDESADEVEVDEPFPSVEELTDGTLEARNSEPCELVLLPANDSVDGHSESTATDLPDIEVIDVDAPAQAASDQPAVELPPQAQVEASETPSKRPPNGTVRRKRKRSRKWVYSTSRAKSAYSKYKRQLSLASNDSAESIPVSAMQAARVSRSLYARGENDPTGQEGPAEEPWDWDECEVYFNRISLQDVRNLEKIRTSCANMVASNKEHCSSKWNRAHHARILEESNDSSQYRVHPTRRGRYYQDVWEEEDLLDDQRRAKAYSGKEQPFQDQRVVMSNSELVYGYNDDLFIDYIMKLESRVFELRHEAAQKSEKLEDETSSRKKAIEDYSVVLREAILPSIPSDLCHPAAMGHFAKKPVNKSRKKKAQQSSSWSIIHPASVCMSRSLERWEQELECYAMQLRTQALQEQNESEENNSDEEKEFEGTIPSSTTAATTATASSISPDEELKKFGPFGSVLENDEISEAINTSVSHLVSLSMLNWRRSQLLYERVQCGEHCESILQQERNARDRLEHLYRKLYPKTKTSTTEEEDGQVREPRDQQLVSRPRDIISYCTRKCVNAPQAHAVGASVEYAMALRVGDQIDVLDRDGRWNGAMVEDVFTEGEKLLKYVFVRFSQWRDGNAEWIGVTEGRVVPHGVATGKYVCCLAPTRTRNYRVEFNRLLVQELDLFFQMNRISRRIPPNTNTNANASANESKPDSDPAKLKPAKKRRRSTAADGRNHR